MTRGTVVVLGHTGLNVGAGMTGGVIYLFTEGDPVENKINRSYVEAAPVEGNEAMTALKSLLERHSALTGSLRARGILDDFDRLSGSFRRVVPLRSYAPGYVARDGTSS
jgi:glutamate synthase domain-containing protein 3